MHFFKHERASIVSCTHDFLYELVFSLQSEVCVGCRLPVLMLNSQEWREYLLVIVDYFAFLRIFFCDESFHILLWEHLLVLK